MDISLALVFSFIFYMIMKIFSFTFAKTALKSLFLKGIKIYAIGFVLLISCDNSTEKEQLPKEYQVKKVNFEEFRVTDISPKSTHDLQNWQSFQSLIQVIVSMAPTKIKNTENLVSTTPDSLRIYQRLYPKNTNVILKNAFVERDWRSLENNTIDTIYRFEKDSESEFSFVQWDMFLVKNVPYTLSVFVKGINQNEIALLFLDEQKELQKSNFELNTETHNKAGRKLNLSDDWKELQLQFTPEQGATYSIQILFNEDAKKGENIIFYRPTLQVPPEYFSKIHQFSDKIVNQQTNVKSSYFSLYLWLTQLDEELNQLLAEDKFPEPINSLAIKSRFRLFQTQIKELADNVKNNSDFEETTINQHIDKIKNTFNGLITRINSIYESDLDDQMKYIHSQIDTMESLFPMKDSLRFEHFTPIKE